MDVKIKPPGSKQEPANVFTKTGKKNQISKVESKKGQMDLSCGR